MPPAQPAQDSPPVTPDETPPPPKPRRWRRRLIVGLSTLLVLLLIATGGIGWYFSGEVINVTHGETTFPLTVIDADASSVTLPRTEETIRPGVWGLQWEGGRAVMDTRIDTGANDSITRSLDIQFGTLNPGTKVRVDGWVYGEDPASAFGLDYQTVQVPTELGDAPAWFVPAEGDTWVVAVHGRYASPRESLRVIPQLHELDMPVLAVTHRNDLDAPESPDGYHHLGDSEWKDVSAAVDYAVDHGARDVVLYGWSMGGAVTMTTLRRMDRPELVAGIVLDSPVLDWSSTLDKQGGQRGAPTPIVSVAKWLVEWRADLDLDDLDQREYAPDMTTPVLLFADTADNTVEVSASLEFASLVPAELMTLVETEAGHTSSWNENPQAYEQSLSKFLSGLG